ncbi:MAG TPA: homocysteine S-methyltransferase family protein [Labilithrix sp.]|nr:homocysteine S-methyltransferase family protein [Labilithrix sp.]
MIRSSASLRHGFFLTDGGLETTLVFHEGIELPFFAAFVLLRTREGRERIRRYYERYLAIARDARAGFVLESPTWRASADWSERLGMSGEELRALNLDSIALMHELRKAHESDSMPIVVSGCVGPRGDGYKADDRMTEDQAQAYHAEQIAVFRDAGVDTVTAMTMTNVSEAIGFARAAHAAKLEAVVAFTVETDGSLPSGESLRQAIEAVDAATVTSPTHYMINCAHPTHFAHVLEPGAAWTSRIGGVRANASRRSHQELDEAPDLDAGDPLKLGAEYRDLLDAHPRLRVLGGCCGTDERHVRAIGEACLLARVA